MGKAGSSRQSQASAKMYSHWLIELGTENEVVRRWREG